MNIIKAFDKAFAQKKERGWDKIYVLVDVHDTIMQGVHQSSELYLWYKWALPALYLLSNDDGVCLILWTGSHEDRIREMLGKLMEHGIVFDYVNENPEAADNDFYCGSGKIYFNVGIDDRFGFEPETDWLVLHKYLLGVRSERESEKSEKYKNMEKNKITELVGKLGSDSKSESGKAAQTLVEMAEPVFEKWFAVVKKYDGNANISDDGEYLPSRGDIDGVSYSKARKVLVFSYSDGCMGEHIEDFICVKPDDLADPNFLKRVERECWEKAVAREKAELEKLKNKLEKHERNLAELESNEPEK